MRIAIIDTGTNSTRLLVADASQDRIDEIHRQTRVTRLGEGVERGGMLDTEARGRVIDCVDEYASLIGELGAVRTMVLATSSVRDAVNGRRFLQSLADSHGFDWKLLAGEEEAALSFAGATSDPGLEGSVTLFDVGGGSTEVVSGRDRTLVFAESLPVGCVRMTERHFTTDPVAPGELESARVFIDSMLASEIDPARIEKPATTVGVAGTVTSLAAIDLKLESYDPVRIHGHMMSLDLVQGLLNELSGMSSAQRLRFPTMEPGRSDVIVAGTLILERLMMFTEASELTVSELDILDGAALAMASGDL